jgi:hypothetical protein
MKKGHHSSDKCSLNPRALNTASSCHAIMREKANNLPSLGRTLQNRWIGSLLSRLKKYEPLYKVHQGNSGGKCDTTERVNKCDTTERVNKSQQLAQKNNMGECFS